MARLRVTTSLQEMHDADVVIEAVAENEGLKIHIFKELDRLLKPSAILASNTSSISLTRLAAATQRPNQVSSCSSSIFPSPHQNGNSVFSITLWTSQILGL